MSPPLFFVVARVISRDGALEKWKDRLDALCAVSKTEPYSNSYYWGYDLDGDPDTIWGLEGYYHPVGFFMNHVSTDVFKEEMRKVDEDELLRNVQGLGSPDYDLHHYDLFSGFVKRGDDKDADAQNSFVVIVHLWASEDKREQLLGVLSHYANNRVHELERAPEIALQSFAVLKEVNDTQLATATKTQEDYERFKASGLHQELLDEIKPLVARKETHKSQAFIGHIGQDAPRGHL